MNAFLMTGALGRVLTGDPDKLLVHYSAGWSLVPGFIHARGLRIRSKDSNVEFDLRIERCAFHVALWDLLSRRFHVTRVHGEGITFVARRRIDSAEATPQRLAALPPIEGLEAVPLRTPSEPPPDDAHYNLFTIALDQVDAEAVHEIWVDTLRFEGNLHVVGGFFLRPIRHASVGPATAYVRSGQLTIGKDIVCRMAAGRVETTIEGFDPRQIRGAEVLHRANAHVWLDAQLPGVAFLGRLVHSDVAIGGGAGRLTIDAGVSHGRIAPSSQIDLQLREVDVAAPPLSLTGDLSASVRTTGARSSATNADATASTNRLEAQVTLRNGRVVTRGFEPEPLTIGRLDLIAHSSELDLVDHPLSDTTLSVRLPAMQVADARFVDAWLDQTGGPVRVQGGHGTFGVELQTAHGIGSGTAQLALQDARVDIGNKETIAADQLRAEVRLRHWNMALGRLDLSGSRIEAMGVSTTGATSNWWANLEASSGELDLHHPPLYTARVVAQARDTRPFVSALIAAERLPAWLVPIASASGLQAAAEVEVNAAPVSVDVRDLVATAGPFRLQGMLSKRPDRIHMLALLALAAASVGIELSNGQTHLQLLGADDWYRERLAPHAFPTP